jgi:hypothetical protein
MRIVLALFFLALGLVPSEAGITLPSKCPNNFLAFTNSSEALTCTCSSDAIATGTVYGTDVYTSDSSICRAALHAGAVGENGGSVSVVARPGQSSYPGTKRNGVASFNWGPYETSFAFASATTAPVPVTPPAPAPPPAAAAAGGAGPAKPGKQTKETLCPDNFTAYTGSSTTLTCTCTREAAGKGTVWGTNVYTSDSSVCRAAVHAGIIGRRGGTVSVVAAPGRETYEGTNRNGVASSDWGSYESSFTFAGLAPPKAPEQPAAAGAACPANFVAYVGTSAPLSCTCSGEATGRGSVWGTDVYTTDSSVCRAALHAGVVGPQGGSVSVVAESGRESYAGTTRNGVTSSDWGPFESSFRFASAASAPTAPSQPAAPPQPKPETAVPACPDNFTAYAGTSTPLTCGCSARAAQAGSVWGKDVYTADSSICRAALHAGVIGAGGGKVIVVSRPGQASYEGASRNGVDSSDWGQYDSSFSFSRNGQ